MKIIVSGKRKELTDGLTAAQLIGSETTVRPRYVSIVKRKEILLDGGFEDMVLQDGDTVEFIYSGEEECIGGVGGYTVEALARSGIGQPSVSVKTPGVFYIRQ